MWAGKCKCMRLCPVSFGLAAGITYALTMLVMALIIIMDWAPPEMAAIKPTITTAVVGMHMLWAFIEGFIFGFVMVAFYNLFMSMGRRCCCKKQDGTCGCHCCTPSDKDRFAR